MTVADGIAVDSSGNAYVTGYTDRPTSPPLTRSRPAAVLWHGSYVDAFVAKLNPAGSALVYSTYLGGSGDDCWLRHRRGFLRQRLRDGLHLLDRLPHREPASSHAIAVTRQRTRDAFVAELNAAGSALVYSTYLGGSGMTMAMASPSTPPATPM